MKILGDLQLQNLADVMHDRQSQLKSDQGYQCVMKRRIEKEA